MTKTQILIGARRPGLLCGSDRGSVARSPSASRTPFLDSNSTTNVPTTVKPPARDRSSTVIFMCGRALGGDGLRPLKWLRAVRTFVISHPLGFCISRHRRRSTAHAVGVVHFRTQKGTHARQSRGTVIVAIGTQKGWKSGSRNGGGTAFFVTGRAQLMLWERRGYF